jgi:Fic family protein
MGDNENGVQYTAIFGIISETMMDLLERLTQEQASRLKGGIYHQTQIRFSYNSNRIEGSQLTEEQTRYIYETNTIFFEESGATARIDDIMETINHFNCFDYLLTIAVEPLCEEHIKTFHSLLKSNTSDSKKTWFEVGDYKKLANMVAGIETTHPSKVPPAMEKLLHQYRSKKAVSFEDIVDFHFQFERIHPFQDGNGRVGRLIMFKECLAHHIVPFIIEDDHKFFYYRGLSEYPKIQEYLIDTCLSAQDNYKRLIVYFETK